MTRSAYGSIIRQIGRLMTSIMQSAMKAEVFFAVLTRNGCEYRRHSVSDFTTRIPFVNVFWKVPHPVRAIMLSAKSLENKET